jgi:hypothetical protein
MNDEKPIYWIGTSLKANSKDINIAKIRYSAIINEEKYNSH